MTKRKMPFFFTFKGLSNKPFFNSSIFHFIGTLRENTKQDSLVFFPLEKIGSRGLHVATSVGRK